jgi:SAM-dependent methyltransferase
MGTGSRYERIGHGYATTRREDPRIKALIEDALGDAETVVNVGAGAGSYEPRDRHVIAIEPSDVMAAQRPAGLAPAIRATAGALPLRDASVDAAMAILTVHHWDSERERGVRELRRIARDRVVMLTFDAEICARMWLVADYLPELAELDGRIFPTIGQLADWLGPGTRSETVEVRADTPDWTLASFWAHPERVLDPAARAATSGFARMDPAVVDRVVDRLGTDLETGVWDARHGQLRRRDAYDAGLRLVVADRTVPAAGSSPPGVIVRDWEVSPE